MSLFAPIRGLCPPPAAAGDVAELPYDVMDRAEALAMAAGRPHSFLHVSRPDIDLPGSRRATQCANVAVIRARARVWNARWKATPTGDPPGSTPRCSTSIACTTNM